MPAHRSRTQRWKDSLHNIRARGGGLEFTVAREEDDQGSHDLVWRVRLYDFDDRCMVLEHPGALGHSFPIAKGSPLIGVITVGQNRWMFRSEVLEVGSQPGAGKTLTVRMPESVERCTRRAFGRTSVGTISLPSVDVWTLENPSGTSAAEVASRALAERLREEGKTLEDGVDAMLLPDVGVKTTAHLENIGGGGVGLVLDADERAGLGNSTLYWLAVDLRPSCPAPVMMAARMAHSHTDSAQNLHAGLAFDFERSLDHQHFVLNEVDRFLRASQQTARRAA
jgi:hypothetical protein